MAGCESGSSLASWVSAISTFCAVFVALCGEAIKRCWAKPQLELKITSDFPHCRLFKRNNQSESDSSSDVVEISASLINSGVHTARNTCILICKILVPNAGGNGVKNLFQFRPHPLRWDNQSPEKSGCEVDVVHEMPYYVKIAEIMKPQNEQMDNDSPPHSSSNEGAIIAIALKDSNGQSPYTKIPADRKKVIVSLKILGPDIPSESKHIQIDWTGTEVADYCDRSKFEVRLLPDDEAKQVLKEHFS